MKLQKPFLTLFAFAIAPTHKGKIANCTCDGNEEQKGYPHETRDNDVVS
jgi:hypothetical protein